ALTWWRWRELLFIYIMIAFTIGQNILYYGIPRFRAPIEPMLIILAAGTIWWLTLQETGTLRWIIDTTRRQSQPLKDASDQSEDSLASDETGPRDEHILTSDK